MNKRLLGKCAGWRGGRRNETASLGDELQVPWGRIGPSVLTTLLLLWNKFLFVKGTCSACLVAAWNRLLILRCICGCISEAVLWPLIRDSPFIYYLLAELRHTLYNTSCTLFKSCSNLETFWSLSPQSFSEAQSAAPTAPECLQPDYSLLTSRRNRSCLTALGTEGRKKRYTATSDFNCSLTLFEAQSSRQTSK